MRIIPISNHTNLTLQKSAPSSPCSNRNITFCSIADVFMRSSDKISHNGALDVIKKANINKQFVVELMMYAAKYENSWNSYSKKMLDNMIEIINCELNLRDFVHYNDGRATKNRIKSFDEMTKNVVSLVKAGYPQKYFPRFVENCDGNFENAEILIDIRNEARKRRRDLSYYGSKIKDDEIDNLFLATPFSTLDFYKLMGKDAFYNSFKDKYDSMFKYINIIGRRIDKDSPNYQELLQLVNPKESEKYKFYQNKIKTLKNDWKSTKQIAQRKNLEAEINTITRECRKMEASSVKDYQKKLEILMIYQLFVDDSNKVKQILPLLNSRNKKDIKRRNVMISDSLMTIDGVKCNMFNFANSKYLMQLLRADNLFMENHNSIISYINNFTSKNIGDAFDMADVNVETKKIFLSNKLDYEAWTRYNPKSFLETIVHFDRKKQEQVFLKHLENVFNMEDFSYIPQEEIESLRNSLSKAGINLVLKEGQIKIYKNNKPLKIENAAEFFEIISEEIRTNDFWQLPNIDEDIENAKDEIETILLENCYKEYKATIARESDTPRKLKIQKVDMNNLEYSYFLGNHAGNCCTAVGNGFNQESAPSYVLHKLFSAIEVLDNEKSVGNTMCYFIKVDDKLALMLDNIGLNDEYKHVDEIRDAIIKYAKILGKEIGLDDVPIYASSNPHSVNMDIFPQETVSFKVLGEINEDIPAYFDFDSDFHELVKDTVFTDILLKIN